MTLFRLSKKPALDDFTHTSFKQFRAWEKMVIVRESTGDDPTVTSYIVVIDGERRCLQFSYSIAKPMTELPEQIRSYINSIEIEDP